MQQGYLSCSACSFAQGTAFIVYFSFLSTFLWLNIMCIDMFIAFSGMRMMAGSAQERERKKFMMYAAYSWGIPLVILAISLYTEFGPVPDYILKPEFRETCWFNSDSSRIAYFIAPVGVIIACNIVLFVLTALKIYRLKRETRVLKKGDSRRHQQDGDDNNQRFKLYLKLFIVMGVNWALEIISWIVGGDCYWIPFDLLNTMQGLFVFFIFVWKVKIRRKLAKSLCPRLAAKLKFMVPTTTLNSDRRPSGSTASSNMVNSCADDNKFKLDTVSARIAETVPSAEVTTVT
ncbi:G-protein coupled receptor Mth2-like [Hetaerina americana]|uniref:G-protein coupled receptor Mth2-like n=1 Tax=Hetaerina americana TaxID=62018 RepID=UPI003A7F3880